MGMEMGLGMLVEMVGPAPYETTVGRLSRVASSIGKREGLLANGRRGGVSGLVWQIRTVQQMSEVERGQRQWARAWRTSKWPSDKRGLGLEVD